VARNQANFLLEKRFWDKGLLLVAGVDEVGRGAWAGPLYAAAVILPPRVSLGFSLYDSKMLTPKKRAELAEAIKEQALAFAFGVAEVSLIKNCGISYANEYAMLRAVEGLGLTPDFVLIDCYKIRSFPRWRQEGIRKGDQLSASIAAASIIAKVERDNRMCELDGICPGYNFASHKGYGTRAHREAIEKLGLSKVHRPSFVPSGLTSDRSTV